jgi:hypothetical protein
MRRFPAVLCRLTIAKHGRSTGLAAIGHLRGGWGMVAARETVA